MANVDTVMYVETEKYSHSFLQFATGVFFLVEGSYSYIIWYSQL